MTTATIPMIRPEELVDVARRLAEPTPDGHDPSPEQVRRAVSTAYYALFHELITHATVELCGEEPSSIEERRTAARWFGHSDVRQLAEAVTRAAGGGAASAVVSVLGPPHRDLGELTDIFVNLQDDRYLADYDHGYDFDPSTALSRVFRATLGIALARELARRRDPSYVRFLRLMVGAVKIARIRGY